MRAAVLTEINRPLQILDLEQEPPKAGEVRVRVKAAGVCMSDWHIINGDWPLPLPMVLGHEAAGIVDGVRPWCRGGSTRRPCDLFVPAALRAMPVLLVGADGAVHRPQQLAALADA